MSDPSSSEKAARTRRTGWELFWRFVALASVVGAVGVIIHGRLFPSPKTIDTTLQRVLPDLEIAPRIQLDPAALKDWNVLLISLDTTRANHLNCYGYPYTKTPVLNDLARHGVLFSQAFTPNPATLPAHSSVMTGLYPLRHGARANGTFRLGAENVTLAEILREKGYRTGAAISAFVLDSRFGIAQGFDAFYDDLTVGMKYSPHMFRERAAELTNVPVTEWLRENGQEKFFFWVHYFDPHAPYAPPEPYRSRHAKGPYDGEIEYADEQIGKLLSVLDEIGVRDRTLVIVVSDHGEGLGQHGEQTHSLLVYDSTLHIPMIFSGPQPFPQGMVVEDQVCLTDVMPTVLDLLGHPVPENLDGVSLLKDVDKVRPTIVIETLTTLALHGWAPLIGVRRADCKFILAPEKETYDLLRDPAEETNIHDDNVKLSNELYQELTTLVGANDPYLATAVQQDAKMDEETRRRLESLGYIGSGSAEEDKSMEELPDPKVMVYHWDRVQQGVHLKLGGRVNEAVAVLEESLEKAPRDVYVRQNLSSCYALMGDAEKALAVIEPALEFAPDDNNLRVTKAGMLVSLLRGKQAQELYERVLTDDPESTEALLGLARIAYMRGNAEDAIQQLLKVVDLNPGSSGPAAFTQIGNIHLRAGRYDEAREAFQAALKIHGLDGRAHDGLANVLIGEENIDEAMKHLQLAVKYNPVQLDAMATLGSLYRDKDQLRVGEAWCQKALSINPNYPAALNNLGLIRREQGQSEEAKELYRRAIEAAPKMAAAHLNLAQLLLAEDDEQGAGAGFLAAARANPNDVVALANFATFAYRRGQLDVAAGLYQRAIRLKSDYALAHKHLGLIYASVDRPRASVRHLELALEYAPEDSEADALWQVVAKMEELAATRQEQEELPFPLPDKIGDFGDLEASDISDTADAAEASGQDE